MTITLFTIFGWLCAALTIIGFYLVTYLTKQWMFYGFLIGLFGDMLWMCWGIITVGVVDGSSILVTNAIMAIVALKGIRGCVKKDEKLTCI